MKKRARRLLTLFFAALLLTTVPVTASADMGPKPSVTVEFINSGNAVCYATLLCDTPGSGPWIAWDGTPKTEFYAIGESHEAVSGRVPYEIWKAFADYRDEDGFYFLQFGSRVDETGTLSWSYYPPEHFKILVYYPESGHFAVSNVIHRYPYYARYQIDLENGTAERLQAKRGFSQAGVLLSFLFRLALTLIVELGIALLFSFRAKKQLLCFIVVNVITQFLLNLLLVLPIGSGLSPYLPVLELAVVVIEALVYCVYLKNDTEWHRKGLYIIYAIIANAASYGLGFVVSAFLPGLF